MKVYYKITEIHPEEHSIVVRFWSMWQSEKDLATMWDEDGNITRTRTDYAIMLPIPAPTGIDLQRFIMSHCPIDFFKVKRAVADPRTDTSLSEIMALKDVEVPVVA